MGQLQRLEFPKKSNSIRRRIFKERTRKTLRDLVKAFYDGNNFSVPNTSVEAITASILDDYVELARDPKFSSTILHPDIRTMEALIDKIDRDVARNLDRNSPSTSK